MGFADDLAPTGTLRASINLGNPVLAQGTPEAPRGVTVDLARDLASRLDLPLELVCFTAARDSFTAVRDGVADLGFLAIDPAREADLAFTAPYAVLEGVFAAPFDSAFEAADGVDAPGVRIGVKAGSAYDLFLTRTLADATIVRGAEGSGVADDGGCDVVAGIRVPLAEWVSRQEGWRILEPPFMAIRQALAVPRRSSASTVASLRAYVEARKADGFVEASLVRSGRRDAEVAAAGGRVRSPSLRLRWSRPCR